MRLGGVQKLGASTRMVAALAALALSAGSASASEAEIRKLAKELEGKTAYLALLRSFRDYRSRTMIEKAEFARRGPLAHQYNVQLILAGNGVLAHDTGLNEFDQWGHCPPDQPRAGQTPSGYRGMVCYPTYEPFVPRNNFEIARTAEAAGLASYNQDKSQIHYKLGTYRTVRVVDVSYVGRPNCEWKARLRSWMDNPTEVMTVVNAYSGFDGYIQENCYRLTETGWLWVTSDAVLK